MPAFAVTSSKRSSGPAGIGGVAGSEVDASGEAPWRPPGPGRQAPRSNKRTKTVNRRIVTFASRGFRETPTIPPEDIVIPPIGYLGPSAAPQLAKCFEHGST